MDMNSALAVACYPKTQDVSHIKTRGAADTSGMEASRGGDHTHKGGIGDMAILGRLADPSAHSSHEH